MNTITARKRPLLSSIFLLGISFATSGCSALHSLSSLNTGSETQGRSVNLEQTGIIVYAIRDIRKGSKISAESLESRELPIAKNSTGRDYE